MSNRFPELHPVIIPEKLRGDSSSEQTQIQNLYTEKGVTIIEVTSEITKEKLCKLICILTFVTTVLFTLSFLFYQLIYIHNY